MVVRGRLGFQNNHGKHYLRARKFLYLWSMSYKKTPEQHKKKSRKEIQIFIRIMAAGKMS